MNTDALVEPSPAPLQASAASAQPLAPEDFKVLLSQHTGTMLTLGYVALIAVGMLHEAILFAIFRVNVLDWFGPADFVLAPLRDPLVMLFALAPIPAAWVYWRVVVVPADRAMRARRGGRPPSKLALRLEPYTKAVWIAMLLVWALASASNYAVRKARHIRAGETPLVHLEWVDEKRADTTAMVILGANATYVVAYRVAARQAMVIPTAQVLRITPIKRTEGSSSAAPAPRAEVATPR